MYLSDHDLSQLDEEELLKLPEEVLRRVSVRLLNDLKEARERLKQNSRNSSRPPSSEAPWEKERRGVDSTDEFEGTEDAESGDETPPEESDRKSKEAGGEPTDEARKPGKQPGAEGFGRQQTLAVTGQEEHFPEYCGRCCQALSGDVKKAWTAFETVDLEWADENHPGLRLTNTRHTYYEIPCACGCLSLEQNRIVQFRMTACRQSPAVNGAWSGRGLRH
ncbi:MAG: DUF6444 domain-containing protein [Methylococcales bacterium]